MPFFEEHGVTLLRLLTDRGTEFCGRVESHDYELYLAVNDIDHTKTKAQSPQTNGISATAPALLYLVHPCTRANASTKRS